MVQQSRHVLRAYCFGSKDGVSSGGGGGAPNYYLPTQLYVGSYSHDTYVRMFSRFSVVQVKIIKATSDMVTFLASAMASTMASTMVSTMASTMASKWSLQQCLYCLGQAVATGFMACFIYILDSSNSSSTTF